MAQFAPTVPRLDGEVFIVMAFDAEGSARVRADELDGHLEYVEKRCDDYLVCGPLRHPGKPELIGSFFLLVAEDEAAARAMVEADPYVSAGTYADIQVYSATASAGRFMGGVIWESADAIRAKAAGG